MSKNKNKFDAATVMYCIQNQLQKLGNKKNRKI